MNRELRSSRHVLRRLVDGGQLFDRPICRASQGRARRALVQRLFAGGLIERTGQSGPKITPAGLAELARLNSLEAGGATP